MDFTQKKISQVFISSKTEDLFYDKNHVLLGISPFNSYFSEENISDWIQWAQKTFNSFHIFVPDTLPIYTFLALGYSETKAIQKAKRQTAYLKNKIYRALEKNTISEDIIKKIIIDMDFLENNKSYQEIKEKYHHIYHNNIEFKKECDLSTGWVINGQPIKNEELFNENIAVEYILAEIPLFVDTSSILNVSSSLFVYHQTPQIIKYLYNNHMGNEFVKSNQGFIELAIKYSNDLNLGGVITKNEVQGI